MNWELEKPIKAKKEQGNIAAVVYKMVHKPHLLLKTFQDQPALGEKTSFPT